MNVVEIYVKGRNRAKLLNKLKKSGINIVKSKILSDNELILLVKSTDAEKVFAISADMWYTKLIKNSVFVRFKQAIIANVFSIAAVIVAIGCMFLLGGFVLDIDVSAFPKNVGLEILKEVEKIGVKKFTSPTDSKLFEAESAIRRSVRGIKGVSVKKSANKLVIYGVYQTPTIETIDNGKVYSLYTGVLKEIVVYRGEQKKFEGDFVKAGDILADDGAIACYSVESELSFEFFGDGGDEFKEDCKRAALLLAGGEGSIVSEKLTPTGSGDTFLYYVAVKRLFCYPGGND